MEKRKHIRVPFEVTATVDTGRGSIDGMVENLSMKGIFFATAETLPGDGPLEISINLSGSSSSLSMKLKGEVVRQTEAGIAIEFREMDLDSFTHLRNIIAQNCDDADAAYKEYCQSVTPPE